MMYDETRKQRYIEEKEKDVTLSPGFLSHLFETIGDYEAELDTDACNFTTEIIIQYYKINNFISFSFLTLINSALKQYTQWCIKEGLSNDYQNYYDEISSEIIVSCLNKIRIEKSIITRKQILNWVTMFDNYQDRFLLLGLYEGIKGKDFCELANVKKSDICLEDNTIEIYRRGRLKFSRDLCIIGVEASEADYYYPMTGNQTDKQIKFIPSNNVIKEYPNVDVNGSEFQRGRRIYLKLQRILRYIDYQGLLTASYIQNSGMLEYTLEQAKDRDETPVDYIYSKDFDVVIEKYNRKVVKKNWIDVYRHILNP